MRRKQVAPTNAEFDEALRLHQRHIHIPERLRDIEAWAAKVHARSGVEVQNIKPLALRARRAFKDGDVFLAFSYLNELEAVVSATNRRLNKRGYSFAHEGRKPDELTVLICKALEGNPRTPASAVLEYVRQHGHPLIDLIDLDRTIEWTDRRDKKHTTTWHSFQDRVTKARGPHRRRKKLSKG
jgi:hypothetical protein